jgi:hypothetical protein
MFYVLFRYSGIHNDGERRWWTVDLFSAPYRAISVVKIEAVGPPFIAELLKCPTQGYRNRRYRRYYAQERPIDTKIAEQENSLQIDAGCFLV